MVEVFRLTGRKLEEELAAATPNAVPPEGAPRGLAGFHSYRNGRDKVDWNTCGTAAIASIADFHSRDPYGLPRPVPGADGRMHWDDGQAIDAIAAAGFGPDVVFGWGTTGGRIRDALRSYGLTADVGHSGLFSRRWRERWTRLQSYVDSGRPVPVLIDLGMVPGGPHFAPHWAVAHDIADGQVRLGNCSWAPVVPVEVFLRAWRCWYLPYGFNHCAVYAFE